MTGPWYSGGFEHSLDFDPPVGAERRAVGAGERIEDGARNSPTSTTRPAYPLASDKPYYVNETEAGTSPQPAVSEVARDGDRHHVTAPHAHRNPKRPQSTPSASASLTGSRRAIASATRSRTSSLRASGRFNRISRSASPCRRARSARIRSAGGAGVSRGPSSMRATVTNYADSRQDGERGMGIERAAAPPAGGDRGHRKKLPTSSTASTAAASGRARNGSAAPRRPTCSWSTPPRTRRRCWSRCRSRAAGGTRRRPR